MKKMLMTATVPSMIGQFNMNNIEILQELGYEVHVGCNFEDRSVWTKERVDKFIDDLNRKNIVYHQIDYARSPLGISNDIKSYKQMDKLLNENNFEFIHCHTPVAGVISRMVAHKHKVKVIYTAHGFHFYSGAPVRNWIVFYPIEKFFSRWTDVLITINQEDFNIAKNRFYAQKTIYVPGVGVDISKFRNNAVDWHNKRAELGCDDYDFILLSVGELSKRKNHKVVIEAIAKLPELQIKYLIAGVGELEYELKELAKTNKIKDKVEFLGFRTDVNEILDISSAFVFPSHQEGLPVALMEAMASGKPIICSKIRGNVDLIQEGKGGYLVEPSDVNDWADKIKSMYENVNYRQMSEYNQEKIKSFDISKVNDEMKTIYMKF